MSEEVFATVRQVEERIWIVWVLSLVRLLPGNADAPWRYKVRWCEGNWLRTPHNVKIKQPVMSHAEPDGSAFQKFLDAAAIALQIIPLFRFTCVFTSILPCSICSVIRTEWCNVRGAGRKHCKVQVVWVEPLIIRLQTPLQGYTFCVLIVLLLRLVRPPS